ncbi:hypothetical protein QQ008_01345 [Fulvivirgaceae bacterium BMA10]|uniref:DUF115 domain-containing protein n=1 Tax=Splendidivirga corallicola TaxID=3051826 RepID=A0ABT8KGY4_9BACT|nr:hypothetical protein [Fulvivirgaceae bacterium BMA10]
MNKSKLQVFLENLFLSGFSLLKVILLSKFRLKLPDSNLHDCLILGNGPSLNGFLKDHASFVENKVLFCVNFFARTDLYPQLKPTNYIITSPEYFQGEEKETWKNDRIRTFKTIVEKTDWKLNLIVPALARKQKEWQKIIRKNSNITIYYFNNTPIEGFESINNLFFSLKLGSPRPHNVLIPSILIALNMRFKKIYLTGTDHSWTKDLFVTEDNEVLLSQKHFYDHQNKEKDEIEKNTDKPQPMYKGGSTEKRKIHEVLIKFVYSFRSYWQIKSYAEHLGIEIYNLTLDSFIDAFPKKRIE